MEPNVFADGVVTEIFQSIAYVFDCSGSSTCVTDTINNIVGCGYGTRGNTYAYCLNYEAYNSGLCDQAGTATGCW
jgi:hypothetical protein